jgi:hypothetical protein
MIVIPTMMGWQLLCEIPTRSRIVELRDAGRFLIVRTADGREWQVDEHGNAVPRPRPCRHRWKR